MAVPGEDWGTESEPFEPAPYYEVSTPAQLKVFTDPLRIRVLNVLSQRAATNQQIADSLGEPTAKVLYHVRFLVDAGLVRLIRTEIKGGNVEKYYRSIAAGFVLAAEREGMPEYELGAAAAVFDVARHEIMASLSKWPDQHGLVERRRGTLDPDGIEEFRQRLAALVENFWGEEPIVSAPHTAGEDLAASRWRLLIAVYRDPTE